MTLLFHLYHLSGQRLLSVFYIIAISILLTNFHIPSGSLIDAQAIRKTAIAAAATPKRHVGKSITPRIKRTVVIISIAHYHYEVTSFVACTIKPLGFHVQLWGSRDLDFEKSMNRKCIDEVFNLKIYYTERNATGMIRHYEKNPVDMHIMIYISGILDTMMMKMMGSHDYFMQTAKRVVMVNHQADTITRFEGDCIHPKCTVLNLASHVTKNAQYILNKKTQGKIKGHFQRKNESSLISPSNRNSTISMVTTYPVFELPHVNYWKRNTVRRSRDKICIAIQGNAESKRRNYDVLFSCIENLIVRYKYPIQLRLVGRGSDKLNISSSIVKAATVVYDNVPFRSYYNVLADSDMLVAFTNEKFKYSDERATSSLPAALLCHVPLVMPLTLLKKYDCLWSSPVHKSLGKTSDCSSLEAAIKRTISMYNSSNSNSNSNSSGVLTYRNNEFTKWRDEVTHCKQRYINQSVETFKLLIQ